MHIYIISFLLTILLIWMAKSKAKSRKIKIILLILAAVPMFLVSALRYNVGTDYGKRYVLDYTMLQNGEEVTNLEIGFKIIDYICLIFTTEPELLFIVTSLIVISLFFEVIYKKSSNPILSVIIFFWNIKSCKAIYSNRICITWISIFNRSKHKKRIHFIYNMCSYSIFNAFIKYSMFCNNVFNM